MNLLELWSVLARKKAFERDRIERIEDRIARKTTVVFPDASDIVTANSRQREALLYPLDAIILGTAESVDCPLVSFGGELRDHDAVEPSELLDGYVTARSSPGRWWRF
ncbi:PIN domain-containing protein [Halobellus ruber]|uniref:PIN domain-containing protein n=1 Tax=Halobellus ruber TaxID=2761102 RepID=UPI0031B5F5B3